MADLAGLSARQDVDNLDVLRRHVIFQSAQAVFDDITRSQHGIRPDRDKRLHGTAPQIAALAMGV